MLHYSRRTCCLLSLPALIALAGCSPSVRPSTTPRTITWHEFVAVAPIAGQPDSLWARMIIPPGLRQVRAVIVFTAQDPIARFAYDDRDWHYTCAIVGCALVVLDLPRADPRSNVVRPTIVAALSSTVGDALQQVLERLATASSHSELARAGIIPWGFSLAGATATRLAMWRPERTAGVVLYHSPGGQNATWDTFIAAVRDVPVLLMQGGDDRPQALTNQTGMVARARAVDAPWAFQRQPGAPHHSVDGLIADSPSMLRWIAAVIDWHAAPDRRSVRDSSAKVGYTVAASGGPVVRGNARMDDSLTTSWLPDRRTAFAWLMQRGECQSLRLDNVSSLLGERVRIVANSTGLCEYQSDGAGTDAQRLLIAFSGLRVPGTGIFENRYRADTVGGLRPGQTLQLGLGDRAFAFIDSTMSETSPRVQPSERCATMRVAIDEDSIDASLCGRGHGTPADYPFLARILQTILGAIQP